MPTLTDPTIGDSLGKLEMLIDGLKQRIDDLETQADVDQRKLNDRLGKLEHFVQTEVNRLDRLLPK